MRGRRAAPPARYSPGDRRGEGPRYVAQTRLRGRGSGAETVSNLWLVIEMRGGSLARAVSHLDRASADGALRG